jgi:hypothetical protein
MSGRPIPQRCGDGWPDVIFPGNECIGMQNIVVTYTEALAVSLERAPKKGAD